jgi:hypothetical protein
MTYENVVITLILLVDLVSMHVALKSELRRSRARMTYRFNKILKSAGMR